MKKRRPWTAEEKARLRKLYPDLPTAEVARALGRTEKAIYNMAVHLGLSKSAEYMASPAPYTFRRDKSIGAPYRFRPGHVPYNKGLRRPGWAPGRMKEAQFKKGQKPPNLKPIGAERWNKGYLQRKMTDTGYPPRDWVPVHVLVWLQTHRRRKVPKGHVVVFRDGDKTNLAPENLELVSRAELLQRNSLHRYPKPLVEVIQLRNALVRKINRLSKGATT